MNTREISDGEWRGWRRPLWAHRRWEGGARLLQTPRAWDSLATFSVSQEPGLLPSYHTGIHPHHQFTSPGLGPAEKKRLEEREAVIYEVNENT